MFYIHHIQQDMKRQDSTREQDRSDHFEGKAGPEAKKGSAAAAEEFPKRLSLGRLAWLPSTLTDLNITSSDAGRQVTGVTAAAPEEVSSATGHRQESRTGRKSHRRNRRPSQIHSDCLLLLPAGNAATVRRVSEESLESATASNEQRSSRSSRSRIRIRKGSGTNRNINFGFGFGSLAAFAFVCVCAGSPL